MTIEIRAGIGWIPDPEKPGWQITAEISDYVAEIERLQRHIEAAEATILRLINEKERLRAALEPFVAAIEMIDKQPGGAPHDTMPLRIALVVWDRPNVGDLRRARAALVGHEQNARQEKSNG